MAVGGRMDDHHLRPGENPSFGVCSGKFEQHGPGLREGAGEGRKDHVHVPSSRSRARNIDQRSFAARDARASSRSLRSAIAISSGATR